VNYFNLEILGIGLHAILLYLSKLETDIDLVGGDRWIIL
jgi:hypothetical protein